MNTIKKITAWLLCMCIITGLLPTNAFAAEAPFENISNGYLSVSVSNKNGGFTIDTMEGNKFYKSDNNKFLLYPDSDFDTSFTSFRITEGTKVREYIFGRNYGFLGANSSDVKVTVSPDKSSISAEQTIDGITFVQTLSLAGRSSAQHGMVSISHSVKSARNLDDVKVRVLLDTALGYQDYGTYELPKAESGNQDRKSVV